jgi:hypothetical protein
LHVAGQWLASNFAPTTMEIAVRQLLNASKNRDRKAIAGCANHQISFFLKHLASQKSQ